MSVNKIYAINQNKSLVEITDKEFLIEIPIEQNEYETITDSEGKVYYKLSKTIEGVRPKYTTVDLYLENEILLQNIENAESEFSNLIRVNCLIDVVEIFVKQIPTNSYTLKIKQ